MARGGPEHRVDLVEDHLVRLSMPRALVVPAGKVTRRRRSARKVKSQPKIGDPGNKHRRQATGSLPAGADAVISWDAAGVDVVVVEAKFTPSVESTRQPRCT